MEDNSQKSVSDDDNTKSWKSNQGSNDQNSKQTNLSSTFQETTSSETYQQRVDRNIAESPQEKQSKTETNQTKEITNNMNTLQNHDNSTGQTQNTPRETYQERVDRKMAEYQQGQAAEIPTNTASNNNSSTNTTSNETYEDRVDRKMAEYEREKASKTNNNNNNVDEHARDGIPDRATTTVATVPSTLPNESEQRSNENLKLVSPENAQADDVNIILDSKERSLSSRLSGTPNSQVRKAILNDKGVDSRTAYLQDTEASQRKNRPGVYFEEGLGPGSVPAWARPNANSAPSGPPVRQYHSLVPATTDCADVAPPPRRYHSATPSSQATQGPSLTPDSATTATMNPTSPPSEEVIESVDASTQDSNIGATGITIFPMESASGGHMEGSPADTNDSTSMATGTMMKSSETPWYCKKSVLVTATMLLLAATSLGIVLPLLSNGNSKSKESNRNSPSDILNILSHVANSTLIQQNGTPQQLAFDWIVKKDMLSSPQKSEKLKNRYALAVLYFATGGDSSWRGKDNWLDGEVDECDWEFLTCSEGEVTKIEIWQQNNDDTYVGNGLIGTLPIEELTILTELEELGVIRNNKLSGTIDPSISSFTNLRKIYLNYNDLSGTIPDELFDLSTLEVLSLGRNDLEGSVSTSIGQLSNLVELDLYFNLLTGSIPDTLYDLTSLAILILTNNMLSSSISTEIGLLSNLEYLSLSKNPMSSSLPTEMGLLTQLALFNFRSTEITGTLPKEIYDLKESYDLKKLCCNVKIADDESCCSEDCKMV